MRRQRNFYIVVLLCVAVLLVPVTEVAAQYTSQVKGQLMLAGMALMGEGYEMTGDPYTGRLNRGSRDEFTVYLRANQEYTLVGVCDEDCNDLDMYLYDDDGDLVSSDVRTDSLPIVSVKPRWSGNFKIRVKMIKCSTQPCFYGVGNFRK